MRISDWSSDVCSSDLFERRRERLFAFFPLGGADFVGVRRNILRGLDLAQQLRGIAADTFAGDLHQLDHALRIDDEGRAIGEALAIAPDIEIGRERVVVVADRKSVVSGKSV